MASLCVCLSPDVSFMSAGGLIIAFMSIYGYYHYYVISHRMSRSCPQGGSPSCWAWNGGTRASQPAGESARPGSEGKAGGLIIAFMSIYGYYHYYVISRPVLGREGKAGRMCACKQARARSKSRESAVGGSGPQVTHTAGTPLNTSSRVRSAHTPANALLRSTEALGVAEWLIIGILMPSQRHLRPWQGYGVS